MAAAGYSGADMELDKIEVYLGELRIVNKGKGEGVSKEESRKELQKEFIKIKIDMNLGEFSSKAWGCDLSYDYVKINAQYHT